MIPAIYNMMGLDRDEFYAHYARETLHDASDLVELSSNKWLTLVSDINGSSSVYTFQKGGQLFGLQWISPVPHTELTK